MQNLKQSVLFLLMAVFVGSFAIVPAHAQSRRVSANVPFDFAVGDTTLAAGAYRVETHGSFVAFVDPDGRSTYSILLVSGDAADQNGEPYLIFRRYGSKTFLKKIVFSAVDTYDLPRSSMEAELVTRNASGEPEDTLVGAGR